MTISKKTLDRLKQFATDGDSCATALLHILERLEALEALRPTPEAAPVATDEGGGGRPHTTITYRPLRPAQAPAAESAADRVLVNCPETCWVEIRRIADGRVIYNNHQKGNLTIPVGKPPTPPAAPAGGLVERVATAMQPGTFDWSAYESEARAAIREVAAWLDQRGLHGCSLWLREEVDRE
ncbi:MAG: hypothetical protein EBZ51_08635 [Synechococcaceae bacterium WB9_2_112]|nr:hypothetical protein [Synechococcaceae bacterium WB9_2_112]